MIEHAGIAFLTSPPDGRTADRLIFLGDDAAGSALEVMAVERSDGGLHIIHAMPLRATYRARYEEARRWRV